MGMKKVSRGDRGVRRAVDDLRGVWARRWSTGSQYMYAYMKFVHCLLFCVSDSLDDHNSLDRCAFVS